MAADGNWYPPELHPEYGTAIVRAATREAERPGPTAEDSRFAPEDGHGRRPAGGDRDADATIARALRDFQAPRLSPSGRRSPQPEADELLAEVLDQPLNRLPPLRSMHGPISGGRVHEARREAAAAAARAIELGRTSPVEPYEFFAGRSTPLRRNVPAPLVVLLVVLLLAAGGGVAYLLIH